MTFYLLCLGVGAAWLSIHDEHKQRIYETIDVNDYFNIMLDEASCKYDDYNVTVLLYNVEPTETPRCLDLITRNAPADAEGMYSALMDVERRGNLERDNVSSIGCDSASYLHTLARHLKPHYRYAVIIFDVPHRLNNSVKKALHIGYGNEIRKCLMGLRAPFAKSHSNRYNYKKWLSEEYLNVCYFTLLYFTCKFFFTRKFLVSK